MENDYFEQLHKMVRNKKISIQEAVKRTSIFIQKNYALFEMDDFDDDFKCAIILEFLQHGYSIFKKYNKSSGSFFTYIYSHIRGLVMTERKRRARQSIVDKVDIVQSLEHFFEMQEKNDFTLVVEDSMCVPYAYNGFKKGELQQTVKDFMSKRRYKQTSKSIIILALKASYDITGEEIKLICTEFGLNEDDFHKVVQNLKSQLAARSEARNKIIRKRNKAYYFHMKYSDEFAAREDLSDSAKKEFDTKFERNTQRWEETNTRLRNGLYHLSPTNDAIAEALGISSRQVCYYIHTFKEQLDEIKNKYRLNSLYSVINAADENDSEEN